METIDQSIRAAILAQSTDKDVVTEATAFRTVPTGSYRGEIQKVEERLEYKPDAQGYQKPDRFRYHLQVKLYNGEDKPVGTVFADVSPVIIRTEKGNLDGPSKLWGTLAKALGTTSNQEIADGIAGYPYKVYVEESFDTPEGLRSPKSAEEKAGYVEAGYHASNFVRSFGRLA